MTESVMVALPPVVLTPPPADAALFLIIVLEATFSVPWLEMPPPLPLVELPLTDHVSREFLRLFVVVI
jgi:hypothetical protein